MFKYREKIFKNPKKCSRYKKILKDLGKKIIILPEPLCQPKYRRQNLKFPRLSLNLYAKSCKWHCPIMFLTKRLHLSSLNKLTVHLKTPRRQVRLLNFWPQNLRLSQALSAVDPCCFDIHNSCNSRTITFSLVAAHFCNRKVEMCEQQLNRFEKKS